MDVFDGEPYADLLPRWLVRSIGWALLISIAIIPAARAWFIDQAQQHVIHEIQPLLDSLVEVPKSGTPADPPK